MVCGGLNANGRHMFIYLNAWSLVYSTDCGRIKRCGLSEGGASLGVGFEDSEVHTRPSLSLWVLNLQIGCTFSATALVPCWMLPCSLPWLSGLILWNSQHAPYLMLSFTSCLGRGVCHGNKKVTKTWSIAVVKNIVSPCGITSFKIHVLIFIICNFR